MADTVQFLRFCVTNHCKVKLLYFPVALSTCAGQACSTNRKKVIFQ